MLHDFAELFSNLLTKLLFKRLYNLFFRNFGNFVLNGFDDFFFQRLNHFFFNGFNAFFGHGLHAFFHHGLAGFLSGAASGNGNGIEAGFKDIIPLHRLAGNHGSDSAFVFLAVQALGFPCAALFGSRHCFTDNQATHAGGRNIGHHLRADNQAVFQRTCGRSHLAIDLVNFVVRLQITQVLGHLHHFGLSLGVFFFFFSAGGFAGVQLQLFHFLQLGLFRFQGCGIFALLACRLNLFVQRGNAALHLLAEQRSQLGIIRFALIHRLFRAFKLAVFIALHMRVGHVFVAGECFHFTCIGLCYLHGAVAGAASGQFFKACGLFGHPVACILIYLQNAVGTFNDLIIGFGGFFQVCLHCRACRDRFRAGALRHRGFVARWYIRAIERTANYVPTLTPTHKTT